MNIHLICRDDFNEYEVVAGSNQPLSSCAHLYNADDDSSTFYFITRLRISPQAWIGLLMRLGCSIPNDISHPGQIYTLVTNLCRMRQLRFYKLPDIKKYVAMSSRNADWGIALVRGPNPHCHTNLRPEIINTAADAEALLQSVEANEDKILISAHNNNLQDIFPRYDRQNIPRLVDYLLNKKVFAYKIPVRRNNNSAKPEEYIPAGGVGDRKVQPIPYKGVEQNPQEQVTNSPPQSLDDAAALLAASRAQLTATKQYQPKYTSAQLDAMAKEGVVAKERFIVSLQKKRKDNEPVGFMRDSGRATAWTTTLDLAERADTDPELLCDLNGMHYDSTAEYEVIIIDQGKYYRDDGAVNFVPTYKSLGELGKKEFELDFSEHQIESVLTKEYAPEYKALMVQYGKTGGKPWEEKNMRDFADGFFKNDEASKAQFKARNIFNTEIGCNEHFSGDGVTKTTGESPYKLVADKNGNLEMLLFEHNPETVGELEARGAIKRIPAKPIRRV